MNFDLTTRTRELLAHPFAQVDDPDGYNQALAGSILAGHYDGVVEFGVVRTALHGEVVPPERRLERARDLLLAGYVGTVPIGFGGGRERTRQIAAGEWDRTAVIVATIAAMSPEARA